MNSDNNHTSGDKLEDEKEAGAADAEQSADDGAGVKGASGEGTEENTSEGDIEEMTDEDINLPDADFSELDESNGGGVSAAEMERLKVIADENREKYIRALAELENFKKRALKERSELQKYQGERVLYDMLEIIDNLELALQYAEADPAKIKEGLELIHKKFRDTLEKWQVRGESALDREFDPSKQNAISKVAVKGKKAGTVINELKKAYFYKDKLLRAAEVVVADEPPAEDQGQEEAAAEDEESSENS